MYAMWTHFRGIFAQLRALLLQLSNLGVQLGSRDQLNSENITFPHTFLISDLSYD
jgi:hypothetical protein